MYGFEFVDLDEQQKAKIVKTCEGLPEFQSMIDVGHPSRQPRLLDCARGKRKSAGREVLPRTRGIGTTTLFGTPEAACKVTRNVDLARVRGVRRLLHASWI